MNTATYNRNEFAALAAQPDTLDGKGAVAELNDGRTLHGELIVTTSGKVRLALDTPPDHFDADDDLFGSGAPTLYFPQRLDKTTPESLQSITICD